MKVIWSKTSFCPSAGSAANASIGWWTIKGRGRAVAVHLALSRRSTFIKTCCRPECLSLITWHLSDLRTKESGTFLLYFLIFCPLRLRFRLSEESCFSVRWSIHWEVELGVLRPVIWATGWSCVLRQQMTSHSRDCRLVCRVRTHGSAQTWEMHQIKVSLSVSDPGDGQRWVMNHDNDPWMSRCVISIQNHLT